jgi:glycerol-3-phosphate O-acyltransferase
MNLGFITGDRPSRSTRDGRYRTPRAVAGDILASQEFRVALDQLAIAQGRTTASTLAEARHDLKELVSTPSPLFLDIRARFDRFVFMRGYEREVRIDPAELERLRETMREHPTVLLFTHKTYTDASVPGMLLYENDLPMLHTFGGINLDIAGFGALMRRSGGIFIRRSFRDDSVYKLVLRRYVAHLLERRFPMSWALEGTRSRIGKLMPPRYGLLKYTLDAAHDAGIENLHIFPFVTSFDQIYDVQEYAAEQIGSPKKPETLRWLWSLCTRASRPMGRVRVDLGESVVIRHAPSPDDKLALAKIGMKVCLEANRVTPLTVTGVMCLVLLGTAPRGATARELVKLVAVLAAWARSRGIRMSDELVNGDHAALFARLDALVHGGLILRCGDGQAAVYAIEPSKHAIASYYRNSIVHHFLDKAIIELALCKAGEESPQDQETAFWAETARLRDLFKFEFFYPPRTEFRQELLAELQRTDRHWREHLTSDPAHVRLLAQHLQPFIAHAALLPYVEAYTIVLELLARLGPDEQLDEQRCVTLALREAPQAYLLRRISSEASIGRILFENGFRLAAHFGLTGPGTAETIAGRHALLLELRALSRRMERLRTEALANAEAVMAVEAGL